MKTSTMTTYFTTDLDGSGQTVAVADAGLDEDHGDFGTRGLAPLTSSVTAPRRTNTPVTAHTFRARFSVMVLAAATGGVAQADLYFQAMENDNTGNFQSPSLNNLLNTAYNAGAHTHQFAGSSAAVSNRNTFRNRGC